MRRATPSLIRIWIAVNICLLAGCSPTELSPFTEANPIPSNAFGPGDVQLRGVDGMPMVFVPAGSFLMGSVRAEYLAAIEQCRSYYDICNTSYFSPEAPRHLVRLSAYWIDQTEVTVDQYSQCVGQGGCHPQAPCDSRHASAADGAGGDTPIVCVNWDEAEQYCQWAGGRLPTEAEWEYAFRGPQGSLYPWGDQFDGRLLNYCDRSCQESHADQQFDDGYPFIAPVGSFPGGESWIGALDMAGNVFEWVGDWFGPYPEEDITNPTGPSQGTAKIVRGGSWFYHPARTRGAARDAIPPDTRFDTIGFRCVVPLSE